MNKTMVEENMYNLDHINPNWMSMQRPLMENNVINSNLRGLQDSIGLSIRLKNTKHITFHALFFKEIILYL